MLVVICLGGLNSCLYLGICSLDWWFGWVWVVIRLVLVFCLVLLVAAGWFMRFECAWLNG